MSTKIRIHVSYDGTDFGGWQKQKSGKPTIQGELQKVLSQLFNQFVKVTGSGRTDAGVHAIHQVAHFHAPRNIENYNLLRALNSLTPSGIAVHNIFEAPEDFHARASAMAKKYFYFLLTSETPSALRARYTYWQPHSFDLEKLMETSKYLVGEHDFQSFQTRGTDLATTVRKVTKAEWTRVDTHLLRFEIEGSGFLKQMVRNIVGSLLEIERRVLPAANMKEILESYDRKAAYGTAPPHGLYLARVFYPKNLDSQCRKI